MINDSDLDCLVKDTIAYLGAGYRHFGELSDTDISLISAVASLVFSNYIMFDSEFKDICYTWEFNREHGDF